MRVKMIFGILSLVIVLGVVASLVRKQTQAVGIGIAAPPVEAANPTPASVAGPAGQTVAGQARSIEQRARDDVTQALKKAADRNERADP